MNYLPGLVLNLDPFNLSLPNRTLGESHCARWGQSSSHQPLTVAMKGPGHDNVGAVLSPLG
jgi:hypothetical protein